MVELLGKSKEELRALCMALGEPAYRGGQVYHALYAERTFEFARMTNLTVTVDWSSAQIQMSSICRSRFVKGSKRKRASPCPRSSSDLFRAMARCAICSGSAAQKKKHLTLRTQRSERAQRRAARNRRGQSQPSRSRRFSCRARGGRRFVFRRRRGARWIATFA